VVYSHIHKATVLDNVIHAVRRRFPVSKAVEIVDVHHRVFSLGLPFSAVVLEIPNQFFFLAINGDDGVPFLLKRGTGCGNMTKLEVTVGVRHPFDVLLVRLEREPERGKHLREG
jgi:hypothetical protein